MSYEFTKLSGVPAVDEFPEGANAIIETNGEIKRCSSAGGSSVPKPLTYDYMPEGFDPNGIANQQFVTDETGAVKWEDKDVYNVIFTINGETGEITADKTFEDVKSAFIQGKEVRALYKVAMGDEQIVREWSTTCVYHYASSVLFFLFSNPYIPVNNWAAYDITVISMDATQIKESVSTNFLSNAVFSSAGFRMMSSTDGSTKIFRITVDDSGTISATGVT